MTDQPSEFQKNRNLPVILVNYNFTPDWLKEYDFDYHIFDRSDSKEYVRDFPQYRITYTPNIGNVDYDKLKYLVEHYDNLPDVFLWGKTNLFKYISKEEFDALPKDRFTPLLTQKHRIYADNRGQVNYYHDGMYHERNDGWYLHGFAAKFTWDTWAKEFGLPSPAFIPFPPGGNFILTKEVVHKHPKELYERMMNSLPYCQLPGEAQLAERSYYLLWS